MVEEACHTVDILLLEMERAYRNVEKNKSSKIKLPAKELDLLTVLEKLRDKMNEILRGDREIMKAIFVGEGKDEDCERIARIRAILDVVEFSPMNAEDGRRAGIMSATDSVEQVMIDLGSYDALKAAEEAAKKKLLDAARQPDVKEQFSGGGDGPVDDDGDPTPTLEELKAGLTVPEPEKEDDPKEYTERLIRMGLRGLRERPLGGEPFKYPTDPTLEHAGELALLGFENLNKGVARLHMSASKESDVGIDDVIKEIPDQEIPRILQFLVTLWQARPSHRAQCQFVADKLAGVSPRFRAEVERRSGSDALARGDRLPWLKDKRLPTHPKIKPGDKVVAVWIDMNRKAFEQVVEGCQIKGFEDDWRDPKKPSNAPERAHAYMQKAIPNEEEHVVAIVINNGTFQKQMLIDMAQFAKSQNKAPPLYLACSRSGGYPDFAECGVSLVSGDWKVIRAILKEETDIRKNGGHTWKKRDECVVFVGNGWTKGVVDDFVPDVSVDVTYGDKMQKFAAVDFGSKVRSLNSNPLRASPFYEFNLLADRPEKSAGYA